jgi:hypothetical protein
MDRGATAAVILLALLVFSGLYLGWQRALRAAGPVAPSPAATASPAAPPAPGVPPPAPQPTPRLVYPDTTGVTSATKPQIPERADDLWLFDNAVIATENPQDLAIWETESLRPNVGVPDGVTRNSEGHTPGQRRLLLSGQIVQLPRLARVEPLTSQETLVQVRVRDGEKAGAVGWVSRYKLYYNRSGRLEPVYPVQLR